MGQSCPPDSFDKLHHHGIPIRGAHLGGREGLGEFYALPGLRGECGVTIGAAEIHAALCFVVSLDVANISRQF